MPCQQQIAKVQEVLAQLRPVIQRDGGDIEFVRIEDDIVYVRLHGACVGCPSSYFTLKMGVQEAIQAQIPEIKEVLPVE